MDRERCARELGHLRRGWSSNNPAEALEAAHESTADRWLHLGQTQYVAGRVDVIMLRLMASDQTPVG